MIKYLVEKMISMNKDVDIVSETLNPLKERNAKNVK